MSSSRKFLLTLAAIIVFGAFVNYAVGAMTLTGALWFAFWVAFALVILMGISVGGEYFISKLDNAE